MTQLYLPALTLAVQSVMTVSRSKIRKNLGRGAVLRAKTAVQVTRSGRVRAVAPEPIQITTRTSTGLRSRVYLRPLPLRVAVVTTCDSFLLTIPVAVPEGRLYRSTLAGLRSSAQAPSLNRSRLVIGDSVPLAFQITGQKLAGLNAQLIAKPKVNLTAPTIIKQGGSVHQTSPVLAPDLGTETMMGQLTLESGDTAGLTQETEFDFQLKFTDGLGRVYTVEVGTFTVYLP